MPRAELVLKHGVPKHSRHLALYYAVQLRDLIQRYAAAGWALYVSDPALARMAARQARLARWIARD